MRKLTKFSRLVECEQTELPTVSMIYGATKYHRGPQNFESPLFNLAAYLLRLMITWFTMSSSALKRKYITHAHLQLAQSARAESDENAVNITAATEEERG